MRLFISVLYCILALAAPAARAFDQGHGAWTQLLQKYVSVNGSASQVDYVAFKAGRPALDAYTTQLSRVTAAEFAAFTRPQQMAFLINAYNAFTVTVILDHYPVNSIKDIGSLFKNTWKIKFFKLFGEDTNLDTIEHQRLRKDYHEPRVHFAVNCASVGCPALRPEAYRAADLESQLDAQAKLFLSDTSRNQIDAAQKTLRLSMIFKWFHEDFERDGSTVQKFISGWITADPKIQKQLQQNEFKVDYLDYDWRLNKK